MHGTRKRKRKVTEPNDEVFTPPVVVDYMLAAIESQRGRPLSFLDRVLEPSAGDGAFVRVLVRRISMSVAASNAGWSHSGLEDSLRAFEVNPALAASLRNLVFDELQSGGCPAVRARELVASWIREEDFLTAILPFPFDAVVGNPPYVRYDAIDKEKVHVYRRDYCTFSGRCDLYVPFIQRALSVIAHDGVFCFICSNRFAKNDYGARLRSFISGSYHIALYLNLEHADVFGPDVAAYPAIVMADRKRGLPTLAATVANLAMTPFSALAFPDSPLLMAFPRWYAGNEPWTTTDPAALANARKVQRILPLLVDSAPGTRFGIGVATGADAVFVQKKGVPGVEEDCLLPLVTGDDVRSGRVRGENVLVNPFRPDETGLLRDFAERPGLTRYLERHRAALSGRFVAKNKEWYRTIDRVNWSLFRSPKILLPDIQSGGIVGLDATGGVYPHHNLYWIISKGWPLPVLAAILRSSFVTRQIREASSEMRGGSIRYQAKNLERLRIPSRTAVSDAECDKLSAAFAASDLAAIDGTVDAIVARLVNSSDSAVDLDYCLEDASGQMLLAMEASAECDARTPVRRSARKAIFNPSD